MRDLLKECIKDEDGFVELRYHKKESRSFYAEKERVENSCGDFSLHRDRMQGP